MYIKLFLFLLVFMCQYSVASINITVTPTNRQYQELGVTIDVAGGGSHHEYLYQYTTNGVNWTTLVDWSTNNIVSFNADVPPGDYGLRVLARDSSSVFYIYSYSNVVPYTITTTNKIMLVSWGDLIFFNGPSIDLGMRTSSQVINTIGQWKSQGFTQIYWRSEDIPMPDIEFTSAVSAEASFIGNDIAEIISTIDTTNIAMLEARANGIEFYIWNSIYDEGTPAGVNNDPLWKYFPWRRTFFDTNPNMEVVDRAGNVQWGVPEIAYPQVRQRQIARYVEFAQKYNPDGVFVYLHTHSAPGIHGDQYGFNELIVDEYEKRYGINILTDNRFDYTHQDFDQKALVVEKWRSLRGEYLTTFLRELRVTLDNLQASSGGSRTKISINTQGGDYLGPPFGNMRTDWRTWIQEGLIDNLIIETWMGGLKDFSNEHYLTWSEGLIGLTPYATISNEIGASGILAIGNTRIPLEGLDGYFDAANRDNSLQKTQRNDQLVKNLATYNHISWISQDFNSITSLSNDGYLDLRTGNPLYFIGDSRYYADDNSSPGLAGPLKTDTTKCPSLVAGKTGKAVCINETGYAFEITRRTGVQWPDDIIDSGHVAISFDLFRQTGTSIMFSTLTDQRYMGVMPMPWAKNFQVNISESGVVTAWNGAAWFTALGIAHENQWISVLVYINYVNSTYTLQANGITILNGIFNAENIRFDGVIFSSPKGYAKLDNIKIKID